jgi:hypothetical protein
MADSESADARRVAQSKTPSGGTRAQGPVVHRRPPPMRVVTKGWWTLEEKEADIEELEKEDRDERDKC